MLTRVVAISLLASACAAPTGRFAILRMPQAPLPGMRHVVIGSGFGELEPPLRDALRARGFHVQRSVHVDAVERERREADGPSARAPIGRFRIEGAWEVQERCAGGGFRFASFRLDLVDRSANEVVLSAGGEGVESEGCRGAGAASKDDEGTLFGDVARVLDAVWRRAPGAAPDGERTDRAFGLASR